MIARALGFLFALACFAGALAGGCELLTQVAPWGREIGPLYSKLRQFEARAEGIDTLFIGSSRVCRHLSPEIFDRTAAQLGRPTHSFNFGIDGMFAPEDSFVCDQVFRAARRSRLRWVFVEISAFLPSDIAREVQPQRVVYWHDWRRTVAACRELLPAAKAAKKKARFAEWRRRASKAAEAWPALRGHLRCFVLKATNLGRGAQMLLPVLRSPEAGPESAVAAADELGPAGDGYLPLTAPPRPEAIALFQHEYAALIEKPASQRVLAPDAQRNLDRMLALIRSAGAEPILLNAPTTTPQVLFPSPGTRAPVLNLCDREKFPVLFEVGHRQDRAHLNKAGAEIFSRLLAEEWLKDAPN